MMWDSGEKDTTADEVSQEAKQTSLLMKKPNERSKESSVHLLLSIWILRWVKGLLESSGVIQ